MNWSRLEFPDEEASTGRVAEILCASESYMMAHAHPLDMLVGQENPGQAFTLYWSPSARRFAVLYHAEPCAKPPRQSVTLLAGSPVVARLYGFFRVPANI